MKIIHKDYKLELIPNTVNFIVGLNGSGKTVMTSSLNEFLAKKLKKKSNWMTNPPEHIKGFDFEEFDNIKDVWHYTAKTRQSHWLDLDITLQSVMGHAALWASEGMSCQAEIVAAFKKKEEKDTLFIFDEIDGNLDIRAKFLFFDAVLPALKGTSIVMSHDPYFLMGCEVFDFTDKTKKTFLEYREENCIR